MIIALGHQSRVGKDTVALMLEQMAIEHGINVKRCGFAWQIKSVAAELYAWADLRDRVYYEQHPEERTQILPKLGMTPVQMWTALGEHLSAVHPLTLVEPVLSWRLAHLPVTHSAHGLLIVPDLRRQCELDAVHAHGGLAVKVVRPDAPSQVSTADEHLAGSVEWDLTIVNDGTVDDLREKVIGLFRFATLLLEGTELEPAAPTPGSPEDLRLRYLRTLREPG
jgi:hypothetical protein